MGVSFLLAVLIAQASPDRASPPPPIVNVQSTNRVCAAIQETTAPTIAGLLQNDRTIVNGLYNLNKWSGDGGTLRANADMQRVEIDVSDIVRNLSAVDRLLEAKEPADTPAPEAERIEGMKKSLRDVAYKQLMTLNVLDGTLESSQLAAFMDNSDLPNFSTPSTTAGFHAAMQDAFAAAGAGGQAPLHSWAAAQAADFFSELHQSEDAAAVAITVGAAGCARIDHAVAPPK
jgi:hypothetical protein